MAKQVRQRPVPLFGEDGWQATNPLGMSEPGLRYFLRQHRVEATARGSVIIINGKDYVIPALFERVIIDLGRSAAAAKIVDDKARSVAQRRRIVSSLASMLAEERSALRQAEIAAGVRQAPKRKKRTAQPALVEA